MKLSETFRLVGESADLFVINPIKIHPKTVSTTAG